MALLNPAGHAAIASVRVAGFADCYHLGTSQYARLLTQYPNFKEYVEAVAKLRATATMHGAEGKPSVNRHHYADETRSLGQLFEVLNPNARQMRRKSAFVHDQDRKKPMLRRKSRWSKALRQKSVNPEDSMRELSSFGNSVLGKTGSSSRRRDSQSSVISEMPAHV